MIPKPVINKWRGSAPWPLDSQVEQDLIISRALVEIFNHPVLKKNLAFRGGTALHKLIFPKPLRYSEDIDLNRLKRSPGGVIIDAVKKAMSDMFENKPKVKQTKNSLKIVYSYTSTDQREQKLKIEINVRETLPQKPLIEIPYSVKSEYFEGQTLIQAFNKEEMIGTKVRALYQRNKGRDLFDLYKLGQLDDVDWNEVIKSFSKLNIGASAKNIHKNLELKMADEMFLRDIDLLLPKGALYDPKEAYEWFCTTILPNLA